MSSDWSGAGRILAGIAALFALTAAPRTEAQSCVADCDEDGTVVVNEIVTGVNILLGFAEVAQCPSADCNGDAVVTVNCLVQAVNGALAGCSSVPMPTVEGPVSGGDGTPFFAGTSFDLAEVGYAQSEYFLSGTARAFRNVGALGGDGRWTVTPADRAPYKTRVVVHRPVDPGRFNGTLFVEWMNVSGGLDAAPDWISAHTEITREGAAWMGLSVQKVGIEGGTALAGIVSLPLKTVDPARYDSLSHPGDSFSYDIFSQAAQAIRRRGGIAPLDALPVQRIIGLGESQSAFRLVHYINAVHRAARMYDGYLVHSRGGFPLPLSEAPQEVITPPGSAIIRDDLDVPTLIFQTETDLTFLDSFAARQPDSATVRLWEVAGTAHADTYTVTVGATDRGDSIDAAKLLVTTEPVAGVLRCDQPINSGPQHFVLKAALAALDRWVRDGIPPTIAPRLEVDPGPPIAIVRDARGNAVGGIRTPAVEVPIATLSGDAQAGSLLCSLFGSTTPFPPPTLVELYGDQAGYLAAIEAATAAAVEAGFILPADAALITAAAAETPIGE